MKAKQWIWKHRYLLLIIAISLFASLPYLSFTRAPAVGDWIISYMPQYKIIHNAVIQERTIPLWTPHIKAGWALGNLAFPITYPVVWGLMLLLGPYVALNYNHVVHHLFAMLGMYFLVFYLSKKKENAFIASVIYGLSAYVLRNHPFWMVGTAFFPWIFLTTLKAFKTKQWIFYSILTGLLFGLQLLGGGILQQYFILIFIFLYLLYEGVRRKPIGPRLVKAGLVFGIIILIFLGLGAVKLTYYQEWQGLNNRAQGLPFEEASKNPLRLGKVMLTEFVKGDGQTHGQIGIIALLLFLGGMWYFVKQDKKQVLFVFLVLAIIGSVIYATGIFHKFFYNYIPGVSAQRGLVRVLFIYAFSAILIIGMTFDKIIDKFKQGLWKRTGFVVLIALLIIADAMLFGPKSVSALMGRENWDTIDNIVNNEAIDFMSKDADIFRYHIIEVKGLDHHDVTAAAVEHDLESIYGFFAPLWMTEYFHMFLGASFQAPAKFWGLANVKYILSSSELNSTDFTFVKEFAIDPRRIHPAYSENKGFIYENEQWLPRAFIPPRAVLVVGKQDNVRQLTYSMMLFDLFDPQDTVIVMGEDKQLDDFSLNSFDSIVLVQDAIGPGSQRLLENYVEQGGNIYPDVLEGETSIDQSDFAEILTPIDEQFAEATYTQYYTDTPNQVTLSMPNKQGFLFVSEKYPLFPGWSAKVDGQQKEFFKANGVFTALPVAGKETVTFTFKPQSYVLGRTITLLTTLLVILLLSYYIIFKKR